MKWFYVIAVVIVAVMVAAPYLILPEEQQNRFSGQIVRYGVFGAKINSVDPATCGDTASSSLQGAIYEGLYTYHYLKRPYEVVPQLADGMPTVSDDGLTYTIKIKTGVLFHRNICFGRENDGSGFKTRELTAEDFVYAFKRIADSHVVTKLSLAFIEDKIVGIKEFRDRTRGYAKGDFSRYQKEHISGIRAADRYTLEIQLTERFPQLLYVLAMNVYAPVAREVVSYYLTTRPTTGGRQPLPMGQRDSEIRETQAVVGTGPYVLTEWVRASRIVLQRNKDFRLQRYPSQGAPGDDKVGLLDDKGKKLPFIDVFYSVFVAESNPAWMLFLTKQIDAGGIPRDVYEDVVSPDKDLMAVWKKRGIRMIKASDPTVYWLVFNMEDSVVGKSKSLRQALCLSFDVETYLKVLRNGRGIRAVNCIPSSLVGHTDAGPGPYFRLDRQLAKAKLVDAKKELVAAGVITPGEDIPTLSLDIGDRGEMAQRMAEFIKDQFQQIGITLETNLNDWPTQQEKVHTKQVQLYTMGWHADYPDAENFLQLYYTPNIQRGTNNSNYSNPAFDALFEQAATLPKVQDRRPLYAKMARMISEDCPVLMMDEPIGFSLVYGWYHNIKPHSIAYDTRRYVRIDVEARAKAGGMK